MLVTLLWNANVVQNSGTNKKGSDADKNNAIVRYVFIKFFLFHRSLLIQK